MKNKLSIEKNPYLFKNKPDIIAEELREAILKGELKGGQQLKQEEIADAFHSSLIPVREGLRRLEAQGLVKFYPNKGAVVKELSIDEVREFFEIRILLEKGAIEFAVDNLNSEDIEYAESILKKMDDEQNRSNLSELNWKFHNTLYRGSNRGKLLELIENMHINVERYMRIYLLDMNYHPTSQEEHYKILEACKNKDKKTAGILLKQHMEKACKLLVEFLEKNKCES